MLNSKRQQKFSISIKCKSKYGRKPQKHRLINKAVPKKANQKLRKTINNKMLIRGEEKGRQTNRSRLLKNIVRSMIRKKKRNERVQIIVKIAFDKEKGCVSANVCG